MEKEKNVNWAKRIERTLIVVLGLVLFASLLYASLKPQKDTVITFNVTGITGSMNATSLVMIHFECIKYCAYHFSDGTNGQNRCYEECSKLGKEVCG